MAPSRRDFLVGAGAAGLGLSTAGCVAGLLGGSDAAAGPTVGVERVAAGLTAPLGFESPPGVAAHYVVDQAGTVRVIGPDGLRGEPFLDVTDRMVSVGGYDERGLLGMAFHPDFPDDDRVFVRYSAPPREGTPDGYDHTFVLASFSATPDRADPGSERTLLEIPEPQMNHNGGAVLFGPDGYLYLGVGDGGAGGDQGTGHVADWYDAVGGGNGQDVTGNLLGSVLRIDVDGGGAGGYAVPGSNPLVGRAGLDEQYAWGFRNPWRMSFGPEGRLIAGDVGQNQYEEVDVVVKGGNYGWNVREGAHCYSASSCPTEAPGGEPLRDPVIEYDHGGDPPNGVAVVGGHVYEGSVDALRGEYVFGDWSSSGSLFAATPGEGDTWPVSTLSVAGRDGGLGRHVLGFGTDPAGELYVCTSARSAVGGSTGVVYRIVPADGAGDGTGGPNRTTRAASPTRTATAGDPTATTATSPGGDGDAGGGGGGGDGGRGLPGFGALATLGGLGGLAGLRYLRSRRRDGGDSRRR